MYEASLVANEVTSLNRAINSVGSVGISMADSKALLTIRIKFKRSEIILNGVIATPNKSIALWYAASSPRPEKDTDIPPGRRSVFILVSLRV
jgi:hypothetical protein